VKRCYFGIEIHSHQLKALIYLRQHAAEIRAEGALEKVAGCETSGHLNIQSRIEDAPRIILAHLQCASFYVLVQM
jgi:hypothetical protein